MAFLYTRGGRCEIRESVVTDRGPRSRTLVSFRGALTPDLLDAAQARAARPFDRDRLCESARRKGVALSPRRRDDEARALLARLQRGDRIDPRLVTLLREALARLPAEPLPEHLAEAAEWLGSPEAARGKALRGLLRAFDRVERGRGPLRERPQRPFPRLRSRPAPDFAAAEPHRAAR